MPIWGGRNIMDNYHMEAWAERFASDFMVFKGGLPFSGLGLTNEDYYSFGQPILAPGDGVVLEVENSVHDNEPMGQMNMNQALGNYIIMDHGNGEFSFMGHFKQGAVSVAAGDSVTQGQQVGLCGNSGWSDMAHLHFQLMDSPSPTLSQGLPAQFQSYWADGVFVDRGEPVRGQEITSAQSK